MSKITVFKRFDHAIFHLSFFSFIIFNLLCCNISFAQKNNASNQDSTLFDAAKNIISQVTVSPVNKVLIVNSNSKNKITREIVSILKNQEIPYVQITLDSQLKSEIPYLKNFIPNIPDDWGLIFLMDVPHAPFLFSTVGRPDTGILIREDNMFCDWLANEETTIRTYSVNMDELNKFSQRLISKLQNADRIRITTKKGTDVTITPRHWNKSIGEVWTPPDETQSEGRIVIDGTAYWGPVKNTFILHIEKGRVINIGDLDISDKQQENVKKDLTRDDNSNVLAELGIGINNKALPDKDLMEAEMARGTCHFGFGNNIMYGGMNKSSYHFDLTVLNPTIEVDGEIICKEGKYSF